MTAWHQMARRNLIIAIGCAALGVTLALGVIAPTFGGAAARFLAAAKGVAGPLVIAQCLADPASFAIEREDVRIYAYDPASFQSANPAAPPADPALIAAWRAGEPQPVRVFLEGDWGGGALLKHSGVGPCGITELRWAETPGLRPRLTIGLSIAAIASLILATGLATTLTTRPLLRRLDALRAAAGDIGTPRYRPAARRAGDPLDVLASVIDDAHQRTERAAAEAQSRRRALEEHLDDVAHDLRTPLTALQLNLEAVGAEADAPLRARIETALGDITYLTQLTANLRAGAALRQDLIDERCDLAEIVARVAARFAVIGRHAGVEVACAAPEEPVGVGCPPGLAEQAVANLVHNAVRYNRPGGHVSVWLQVHDGRFRLEVADDGPGVPEARLASLGLGGRSEGRGHLGLSITRAVCEKARWTLHFSRLDPSGLQAEIRGAIGRGDLPSA